MFKNLSQAEDRAKLERLWLEYDSKFQIHRGYIYIHKNFNMREFNVDWIGAKSFTELLNYLNLEETQSKYVNIKDMKSALLNQHNIDDIKTFTLWCNILCPRLANNF